MNRMDFWAGMALCGMGGTKRTYTDKNVVRAAWKMARLMREESERPENDDSNGEVDYLGMLEVWARKKKGENKD